MKHDLKFSVQKFNWVYIRIIFNANQLWSIRINSVYSLFMFFFLMLIRIVFGHVWWTNFPIQISKYILAVVVCCLLVVALFTFTLIRWKRRRWNRRSHMKCSTIIRHKQTWAHIQHIEQSEIESNQTVIEWVSEIEWLIETITFIVALDTGIKIYIFAVSPLCCNPIWFDIDERTSERTIR